MAESDRQPTKTDPYTPLILLTGATGYVGSRLLPLLEERKLRVRCLARKPDKLRPNVAESTEILRGDVLDLPSLDEALAGVATAYYLVHLMASSANLEKQDREAAESFAAAAKQAGVRRIISLEVLPSEIRCPSTRCPVSQRGAPGPPCRTTSRRRCTTRVSRLVVVKSLF